jgi:hypothetical protein
LFDHVCKIILACYVSTCFSLIGSLTNNSIRLSLLNKPFFNEIMHFLVFMMCLHSFVS